MRAGSPPLELRPLGYGELLHRSVVIYCGRFGVLIALAALVSLPGHLAAALDPGSLVAYTCSTACFLLAQWATITVASRHYQGLDTTLGQALGPALRGAGRMLWSHVVFIALTIAALLCLVLPVFPVFLWCLHFYPVVVLEGLSGWQAFTGSKRLGQTPGTWLRALVFTALLVVVLLAATITLAIVLAPLCFDPLCKLYGDDGGFRLLLLLLRTPLEPLATIAYVVLYYDVRVRHEKLDLSGLAT